MARSNARVCIVQGHVLGYRCRKPIESFFFRNARKHVFFIDIKEEPNTNSTLTVAKAKEDKETPHKDIPLKPLIP
jgi:hypothetical protein